MRINKGVKLDNDQVNRAGGGNLPTLRNQKDSYIERLVKLVPAESISAYPVVMLAAGPTTLWPQLVAAYSLLGMTIFLRAFSSRQNGKKTQWKQVAIASSSFAIWVEVLGGTFGLVPLLAHLNFPNIAAEISHHSDFLITLLLVLWTVVIPTIYKGD